MKINDNIQEMSEPGKAGTHLTVEVACDLNCGLCSIKENTIDNQLQVFSSNIKTFKLWQYVNINKAEDVLSNLY